MPFANGENVGAYRIVEKLGQGGMATVYKAYHPALDRYVAIKVMHPAFMEDPNFLARFQREARIVARLDHPHIIPIYDFAEHQGNPYLVMRFVEGETLKAHIQHGPLEPHEVLRIAQAVGAALAYAHGQGVLHRDIKPSNILLTPEGGVYLTDFGLARMAEAGESTLSRDMMVGTPQYISPEQAKGVINLDARTDIYSLGVVLYELLAGQAPFTADTPYAIIHDHIFTPLPMPRQINPRLSGALERVLLKALAKEPADRFQAVTDLVRALEEALAPVQEPAPAEAVESAPRPPAEPPVPEMPTAPPPPAAAAEQAETAPPPEAEPPPSETSTPPALPTKARAEKRRKRRWPWAVAAAAMIGVCLMTFTCLATSDQRKQRRAENTLEQAQTAQAEGEPEQALALYEEAADIYPQLVTAYVEGSELLISMGRIDEAIEFLNTGLSRNPGDPTLTQRLAAVTLLRDARTARHEQNPVDAVNLYRQAVEADPQIIPAYLECSEVLVELDQVEQAVELLTLGIEANPKDEGILHEQLGGIALITGRVEAAEKEVRWFVEHLPDQAITHAYTALLKLLQGKPCVEAMPDIDQALQIDPGQPWAHFAQATCLHQQGHIEAAQAELEFVLEHEAPPLLKKHAEEMLISLGEPPEETVFAEFEVLFTLSGEIADEELRGQLKEMLAQARTAWENGDKVRAIDLLTQARRWIQENRENLGDSLFRRLDASVTLIIRIAGEAPSSP